MQILDSTKESKREPILAAVGQLQFEVAQFRLAQEYGVETCLEPPALLLFYNSMPFSEKFFEMSCLRAS